jgi:NADPH:quinone reductase-like Zn-dependent oxidoreductase
MHAVRIKQYGGPEVMSYEAMEIPDLVDGHVLVKIAAAGINYIDTYQRSGLYQIPLPATLGLEAAGVVNGLGTGVTRFKVGDQVFASCGLGFGAYADYKCLPENEVVAIKPANMSYQEAAAVPSGALGALPLLRDRGALQKGHKVLVVGASGSVGGFAVQVAKAFGAQVAGVCGSRNMDMVRSLGADQVIDYSQENYLDSSERYDLIFDAAGKMISGLSKEKCRHMLTPNGNFVSIEMSYKEKVQDLIEIKDMIEAGKIKVIIDKSFPLERTAEAHRYVESGHKQGNVVISLESVEQAHS